MKPSTAQRGLKRKSALASKFYGLTPEVEEETIPNKEETTTNREETTISKSLRESSKATTAFYDWKDPLFIKPLLIGSLAFIFGNANGKRFENSVDKNGLKLALDCIKVINYTLCEETKLFKGYLAVVFYSTSMLEAAGFANPKLGTLIIGRDD